jgi:hypothetical protein
LSAGANRSVNSPIDSDAPETGMRPVYTMKTLQANRSLLRRAAKRRRYDSAFKRHLQ